MVKADESNPRTAFNVVPVLVAVLLLTAVANDIQGVALSPVLRTMMADLSLSSAQASWAINATTLAAGIGVGVFARAGDRVGHRKVLIVMLVVGAISALVGAYAVNFEMLLISRIGLGLAMTSPLSWGMLKVAARPRTIESTALAVGAVISVFTPLALLMGGSFIQIGMSWKAVFWVILVLKLITLVIVLTTRETPVGERSPIPLEWLGALGLGIWLTCLLLAITQGASLGWTSLPVIALFSTAVIVFAGWVRQQQSSAAPLVEFRGMDLRQVSAGLIMGVTVNALAVPLYITIPALAQTPSSAGYGLGLSVFDSTLLLLPILPGALLGSYLVKRRLASGGGAKSAVLLGGVVCLAGFVLAIFAHDEVWQLLLVVGLYSLGAVACYNVGFALVAAAGRRDNMSTTFGVQYVVTMPTSAIMTAVTLAILTPNPVTKIPTESAYVTVFIVLTGIAAVGFVIAGLVLVPRRIQHNESSLSEHSEQSAKASV